MIFLPSPIILKYRLIYKVEERTFGTRCIHTVEVLLATTLVSDQLWLRPPFVKPRLICDLNFVMKRSRKRPRPLLGLPSSGKRPRGLMTNTMHKTYERLWGSKI